MFDGPSSPDKYPRVRAEIDFSHPTVGALEVTPRAGHEFDDDEIAWIQERGGKVARTITRASGISEELIGGRWVARDPEEDSSPSHLEKASERK